jgi:ABC-type multidrug transport system ATPase subunit
MNRVKCNDGSLNISIMQRFVEEVLETIELDGIKDSLVGIPGESGLSTEQRKRLTIAVELVSNPSIIFMDEPTSGLDARAAAIVMRAVKNVVATGRTTVCTIHQPSIDIFEAFDEVVQILPSVNFCGDYKINLLTTFFVHNLLKNFNNVS